MKNIFKIMLMSSLALGFCACDDDEVIEGIPQTNEQLPQMVADGVVSVPVINANQSIDLEALKDAKEINVIDIAEVTNLPVDNELKLEMLFADNAELNNASISPVELKKDESGNVLEKGFVYVEDWDNAFKAVFGKDPQARLGYMGFNVYAVKGTSEVYLGRLGEATAVNVTPYVSPFIDTVYYLMVNGEKRAEFKHTGGNIYDNPNFKASAKVDLSVDMDYETFLCPWYIVAKTYAETQDASVARMVFAPESPEATEGKLLTNTGADDIPASGTLILDGAITFTFNAETLDFTIKETPKAMYMIGKFCNWLWDDPALAEMVPVWGSPDKYWTIRYVNAGDGFKFNSNKDWDNGEMGYAQITVGSSVTTIKDNGGNIDIEDSGWYIFVFDATNGANELSIYNPDVYVFGSAAGGLWSASEAYKFTVIDDPNAEWPFVSPDVVESSELRLCIQLPGHEWWHTEFIFFEDGAIQYRGVGNDQNRIGNPAGKVYLNFVTGMGKVE